MARFALVNAQNVILRMATDVDPTVQTKGGARWLPCPAVAAPSFDPTTEIIDGPTYTVNANDVTEVWTKRNQTAQEISDRKDAAVNSINGSVYSALGKIILSLENEVRDLRTKLNAEVVAAGRSAPFTAGQSNAINMTQLKAAIKALL